MTGLGPLAARVQPLCITLDPVRDTAQVPNNYTSAFDPRIVGLGRTSSQIASAKRAYNVTFTKRGTGEDYSVDHTAAIYVMRPDATYAASFLSTSDSSDMVRTLRTLAPDRLSSRRFGGSSAPNSALNPRPYVGLSAASTAALRVS
jgi:cytochrome oxidase Cu insertion factor (SCO1/SenC/PrrC family)